MCDGEDLRYLPLIDRKKRLCSVPQKRAKRLLCCDHVEDMGVELFELVCQRDLEGVVAKRKFDPDLLDGTALWLKIRDRNYSQWVRRERLSERTTDTKSRFQVAL